MYFWMLQLWGNKLHLFSQCRNIVPFKTGLWDVAKSTTVTLIIIITTTTTTTTRFT